MNSAILLLIVTALASIGWMWADDKPQAAAGFAYLLALVMFAQKRAEAKRRSFMASVCTFGVVSQASQLACVIWYPRLSSKEIGACDEGTGMPVGVLLCGGLLLVAAEYFGGKK